MMGPGYQEDCVGGRPIMQIHYDHHNHTVQYTYITYHYHDHQVTQRIVWGAVPLGHIVLTDSASVIQVIVLIPF